MDKFIIEFSKNCECYKVIFGNMDVDLEQIFRAIRGILISLSWDEEVINNYIIELAEELKQNKGEKDGMVI